MAADEKKTQPMTAAELVALQTAILRERRESGRTGRPADVDAMIDRMNARRLRNARIRAGELHLYPNEGE